MFPNSKSLVSSIPQQLLFFSLSFCFHVQVKCAFFAFTQRQKHPTSTPG